ncbi:MAG: 2-hydroxyacyl-CoA dehydratase family protein [Spirochaetota bacterium]|nr:2-hydroxyacyl-CoA dehydratase family protein [Spirochaetota bacterium]
MNIDKENAKPQIGWFCSYVPEELIIAAGLEPVRLQGQVETIKEADSYLFSNFCPYIKHILDTGLRGKFSNLEGIIFANSCDGMRRLYDLWTQYVETPFSYMLEIPKNRDGNGIEYLSDQLLDLKGRLEEVFAVNISNDKLDKAISIMNDHKETIMEIFEKQKEVPSPHKGSKLMALCLDETTGLKEEGTIKLREFIEQSINSSNPEDKLTRILVLGNEGGKLTLFNLIEDAGASVVAFDTCYGLKHYSDLVEKDRDPIKSLARRYLLKPPCYRMPGFDTRTERLKKLCQDYSIDGIIYSYIKFCDYGQYEAPEIERFSKNSQLPLLELENDYIISDTGRIRTRVEAFVEMIRD